jgi:hypothetical protein
MTKKYLLAFLFTGTVLLSACGKKEQPLAGPGQTPAELPGSKAPAQVVAFAPAPAPGPESGGVAIGTVRFVSFDIGMTRLPDGRVAKQVVSFHPGDTWRFSVWGTGPAATLPLKIVVSFEDGLLVVDNTKTVTIAGSFVHTLDAAPPGGKWRVGVYQARLLANDVSVATLDYRVVE